MKVSTEKEYERIKKAIAGDNEAFRQLVDHYKDHSLSVIRSILKDPIRSEDVLQDAFMKVYKNLSTFRFDASFSSWLYRIMVNTSYNELRKNKKYTAFYIENINKILVEQNELKLNDQRKFINRVLDTMKPDEALVLRLHYLSELKIKEIEEITGFKSSKIKVDLHRGRNNFHYKLEKILGKDINYLL
ncbi:MAG: RNA polymerase sigma factor [Bacteroidota bacterium]